MYQLDRWRPVDKMGILLWGLDNCCLTFNRFLPSARLRAGHKVEMTKKKNKGTNPRGTAPLLWEVEGLPKWAGKLRNSYWKDQLGGAMKLRREIPPGIFARSFGKLFSTSRCRINYPISLISFLEKDVGNRVQAQKRSIYCSLVIPVVDASHHCRASPAPFSKKLGVVK